MKLTILLFISAVVTDAAKIDSSRSRHRNEQDKREVEANPAVEKRAPALATSSPALSPGIEYTDSKEVHPDKSPSQQIYEAPVPQIAKISDVLTGQGPSYQAAIASHLYSPVSVYQPRISTPTTYEVAAPVPAQLAYSEHRISVPNGIDYNVKPQKAIKQNRINYEQDRGYQQGNVQVYQLIPDNYNFQTVQFGPLHNFPLQTAPQQPFQQIIQPQPRIIYSKFDQQKQDQSYQHDQRNLKNQSQPSQLLEKQNFQVFTSKPQGALSYATFIYNPAESSNRQQNPQQIYNQIQVPRSHISQQHVQQLSQTQLQQVHQIQPLNVQNQIQLHQVQDQIQPQHVLNQIQPQQVQNQIQPQHVQNQIQPQHVQNQIQPQHAQNQFLPQQIRPQPQVQYRLQHPVQYHQNYHPTSLQLPQKKYSESPQQRFVIQTSHFQNQIQPQQPQYIEPHKAFQRQAVLKQGPIIETIPEQYQAQIQNVAFQTLAAPTFPPIQYFGKFAHSIFGGYRQS